MRCCHGIAVFLRVVSIAGLLLLPSLAQSQPLPSAPQPDSRQLLEDLSRDEWNGRPSGSELGDLALQADRLTLEKDGGWLYVPRTFYNFVLRYELELEERGRQRLYFRTLSFPKMAYELRFERRGGKFRGQVVAHRRNLSETKVTIADALLTSAFASKTTHAIELRCVNEVLQVVVNDVPVLALKPLDALGGSVGFGGERVTYRRARLAPLPIANTPSEFLTAHETAEEGLVMPRVLKQVHPVMPEKAATGHHDYAVWLEAVIDTTGRVVATRFLRRLDEGAGYNDEALRVVKQWQFAPALLNNEPVPVMVTIEVTFTWR
jgi:hypothetical protein